MIILTCEYKLLWVYFSSPLFLSPFLSVSYYEVKCFFVVVVKKNYFKAQILVTRVPINSLGGKQEENKKTFFFAPPANAWIKLKVRQRLNFFIPLNSCEKQFYICENNKKKENFVYFINERNIQIWTIFVILTCSDSDFLQFTPHLSLIMWMRMWIGCDFCDVEKISVDLNRNQIFTKSIL